MISNLKQRRRRHGTLKDLRVNTYFQNFPLRNYVIITQINLEQQKKKNNKKILKFISNSHISLSFSFRIETYDKILSYTPVVPSKSIPDSSLNEMGYTWRFELSARSYKEVSPGLKYLNPINITIERSPEKGQTLLWYPLFKIILFKAWTWMESEKVNR